MFSSSLLRLCFFLLLCVLPFLLPPSCFLLLFPSCVFPSSHRLNHRRTPARCFSCRLGKMGHLVCSNADCGKGRTQKRNGVVIALPDRKPFRLCKKESGQRPARWLGFLPYCNKCHGSFGAEGRAWLAQYNHRQRALAQEAQRYRPSEAASTDVPSLESERADMLQQVNSIGKWGCRHRDVSQRIAHKLPRRLCLCNHMHRLQGVAHCDRTWKHRTRAMRVGHKEPPESSPDFRWTAADFLLDVPVVPDNLRFVVTRLMRHWGNKTKHLRRYGHICTVSTAIKIQRSKVIKAQKARNSKGVVGVKGKERCFFIDFRDCVSIIKGLESLQKHLTNGNDSAQVLHTHIHARTHPEIVLLSCFLTSPTGPMGFLRPERRRNPRENGQYLGS